MFICDIVECFLMTKVVLYYHFFSKMDVLVVLVELWLREIDELVDWVELWQLLDREEVLC